MLARSKIGVTRTENTEPQCINPFREPQRAKRGLGLSLPEPAALRGRFGRDRGRAGEAEHLRGWAPPVGRSPASAG
jgi:hypothetical protein